MSKLKKILCFFSILFLVSHPFLFAEKALTITTYYPSPYGVYNQLLTNYFGVGNNDGDVGLDSGDVPPTTRPPGEVWILGNTGIGTTNPGYKLDLYVRPTDNAGGLRVSGSVPAVTPSIVMSRRAGAAESDKKTIALTGVGAASYLSLGDSTSADTLTIRAGNVGIGTNNPVANTKLEVVGGPIKATGGLILETRTSDPGSPQVGRMWLRTDL